MKQSSRSSIAVSEPKSMPIGRTSIRSTLIPGDRKASKQREVSQEKMVMKRGPTKGQQFRQTTADNSINIDRPHSVKQHALPRPKKKKKVKKSVEVNLELEEEMERRLEEQRRREELERYRQEQFDKMSSEERTRLSQEREQSLQRVRDWERQLQKLRQDQEEGILWQDYVNCRTSADPKSEQDVSVLLFQLNEAQDNLDITNLVSRIEMAQQVYIDMVANTSYDQAKQQHDLIDYYNNYSRKIREKIQEKITQINQIYVKSYELFLDENNQQLISNKCVPFSEQNLKLILINIAKRPDDKLKYEITKEWSNSNVFKIGVFYNPISKAGYRMKPINFPLTQNLQIELPRMYLASSGIYLVDWFAYDLYREEDIPLHMQYYQKSGVFVPRLLELITSSKRSNRWSLKPSFSDPSQYMRPLPYPPKPAQQSNELLNQQDKQLYPPLKVQFSIDKQYYLKDCNDIQAICRDQSGQWTQQNVEDLKVDLERRQVSFMVPGLYPFMAAQVSFIDMPYQDWKLGSSGQDEATLHLTTRRGIKFVFRVGITNVELVGAEDFFNPLKSEMPMQKLLQELRLRGVNLMAMKEDGICGRFDVKVSELENQAIINILYGIDVLSFKSSKFNRTTQSDQLIFQVIENPSRSSNVEEDDLYKWKSISHGLDKCAFIKSGTDILLHKQKGKEYDPEWLKETLSHSNLQILLQSHPVIQEDIVQRVELYSRTEFKSNLRDFLKMLRLLSVG